MFYGKTYEQPWMIFLEEKTEEGWCIFLEQKAEAPWCVFLEQKTEAAWLLCCVCVPVQKKNCSNGFEEKLQ